MHQFPLALELAVAAPVAVGMVPFVVAHSVVVDLGRVASLELHALMDNEDPVDSTDSWPVDVDTSDSHTVDQERTVAHTVDSVEGNKTIQLNCLLRIKNLILK